MSNLFAPECWHTTTLGSVIELTYGKSLPAKVRDGISFPVFGSNGEVGKHSLPLVTKPGLIVGRKGSFGEVHISEEPFFPIDTTYYVDNFHGQPIRYWFYQLRFLPLNQLNRATAIPGLNREDAYAQEITLPPLAEQKVIADKLDTLLAQVENTKARLERIPKILKRFRQSVLAAAVSGRLTEEWRNGDNRDRSFKKLGEAGVDVKTGPFGSALHKSDYVIGGIPVINPMHISEGTITPSDSMTISQQKYMSLEAWHLRKGDVVVGRRGEMGRASVVTSEEPQLCGTGSMILRVGNDALPEYLEIILRSPTAVSYFNSASVGSTMVNLNQKVIKNLEVYFPSLNEQTEIVRRVDQLFAHADRIEQQVNNALARVNNLAQSILAKAFRGELTEQWRKDNPELISGENSAEALLERIKAERAAVKPAKRIRRKTNA
ncbi:restriction endonuclease subunit S [Marinobacter shengliensis]|uniref:restriction endonuclease subunit S n=1 Tax=Marinobacter shengliensis TaxID=1389223 RepID=UPI001108232D|nr:restriction endonuclease subunit S [Marinobacter shengliensis]